MISTTLMGNVVHRPHQNSRWPVCRMHVLANIPIDAQIIRSDVEPAICRQIPRWPRGLEVGSLGRAYGDGDEQPHGQLALRLAARAAMTAQPSGGSDRLLHASVLAHFLLRFHGRERSIDEPPPPRLISTTLIGNVVHRPHQNCRWPVCRMHVLANIPSDV